MAFIYHGDAIGHLEGEMTERKNGFTFHVYATDCVLHYHIWMDELG